MKKIVLFRQKNKFSISKPNKKFYKKQSYCVKCLFFKLKINKNLLADKFCLYLFDFEIKITINLVFIKTVLITFTISIILARKTRI